MLPLRCCFHAPPVMFHVPWKTEPAHTNLHAVTRARAEQRQKIRVIWNYAPTSVLFSRSSSDVSRTVENRAGTYESPCSNQSSGRAAPENPSHLEFCSHFGAVF